MERALIPPPTFSALLSIGPVQEALFSTLTTVELLLQVAPLSREGKQWVGDELLRAGGGDVLGHGIRAADVAAGIHVKLLHRFAVVPRARVLLAPATYRLVAGDKENAAHLLNGLRPADPAWGSEGYAEAEAAYITWVPQWRLGFGPLELAAGVKLVGQEGVELDCEQVGLKAHAARAEGASIVSVHFPQGVEIDAPGPLADDRQPLALQARTLRSWISRSPAECREQLLDGAAQEAVRTHEGLPILPIRRVFYSSFASPQMQVQLPVGHYILDLRAEEPPHVPELPNEKLRVCRWLKSGTQSRLINQHSPQSWFATPKPLAQQRLSAADCEYLGLDDRTHELVRGPGASRTKCKFYCIPMSADGPEYSPTNRPGMGGSAIVVERGAGPAMQEQNVLLVSVNSSKAYALSMENCTSTGSAIVVPRGASLVMEDCRVFGSGGNGVHCQSGKVEATRCIIEDNAEHGVNVFRGEAKLVECVVRNNGQHGLYVANYAGQAACKLMGGTISGNTEHGVLAAGGKVTVAAAEHSEDPPVDRPQTVSSGNGEHDWATSGGEIEGLAEGIQVVAL